jgi:hypothetical protein
MNAKAKMISRAILMVWGLIICSWAVRCGVAGTEINSEGKRTFSKKVRVPIGHHLVQELAAFAVEEFRSHSFRTRKYNSMINFEVLHAEKLVTVHEDPKLSARNFYLTILLHMDGCSVQHTQVVFYPIKQTKMVISRDVIRNHPSCLNDGTPPAFST